jgi:hypothetical protein
MGSMITLGINKFEIDWGKNNVFSDHSCLFIPSDICLIPYYYVDNIVEMKEGYSRKLGSIKKRLDLLGYSLQSLAKIYEEHIEMVPEYYPDVSITFEQFCNIIRSINLEKVGLDVNYGDYDLGEYVSQCIFQDPEVSKHLPKNVSVDKDLGTFFENLDPYITLRLLADNSENSNSLVQWRFADVVEGGWVNKEEIIKPLAVLYDLEHYESTKRNIIQYQVI